MTPEKQLIRARVGLILSAPFFASIALRLKLIKDPSCETLWTDSEYLGYNPEYVVSISLDELKGIIAHEVMHVAMLHPFRRMGREHSRWNIAGDYAINGIIEEADFTLPASRLRNPEYDGKEAEKIYSMLPDDTCGRAGSNSNKVQNQPGNNQQNQDPGRCGEVRDYKGGQTVSTAEIKQRIEEWKIKIQQASNIARSQGKLSDDIDRMIKEMLEPKLPWQEILSRFLTENARNDYTWTMPNRRYTHLGLYLPELKNPELGKIALLIDTSGSISQRELNEMAAELRGIFQIFPDAEIQVLYIDSDVKGSQLIKANDIKLKARGGGGTNYIPGFEWLKENDITPVCAIYMTDGWCNRFPEEPDYPVLWILTEKNDRFNAPFGETIIMNR